MKKRNKICFYLFCQLQPTKPEVTGSTIQLVWMWATLQAHQIRQVDTPKNQPQKPNQNFCRKRKQEKKYEKINKKIFSQNVHIYIFLPIAYYFFTYHMYRSIFILINNITFLIIFWKHAKYRIEFSTRPGFNPTFLINFLCRILLAAKKSVCLVCFYWSSLSSFLCWTCS